MAWTPTSMLAGAPAGCPPECRFGLFRGLAADFL